MTGSEAVAVDPVQVVADAASTAAVDAPSLLKAIGARPAVLLRAVEDGDGAAVTAATEAAKTLPVAATGAPAHKVVRPAAGQRALYYQLMDGLYDAVLILDSQGHVVDVNQRVLAMLGYGREEAWDLPVTKILSGMTQQMFAHLKNSLKDSSNVLIDARCHRKDGSTFACEVGVSTLNLTSEPNIVLAIRNIERRKTAITEALRVQSAFEVALSPAFVCTPQGFFVAANQALLDLIGVADVAQARQIRLLDVLPEIAHLFVLAVSGQHVQEEVTAGTGSAATSYRIVLLPALAGQRVVDISGSLQKL